MYQPTVLSSHKQLPSAGGLDGLLDAAGNQEGGSVGPHQKQRQVDQAGLRPDGVTQELKDVNLARDKLRCVDDFFRKETLVLIFSYGFLLLHTVLWVDLR